MLSDCGVIKRVSASPGIPYSVNEDGCARRDARLNLNVTSEGRRFTTDPLTRYFRALSDVLVQSELLKHEEVVYLGVMPPYLGAGADWCQLEAWELVTLVAEFQAFYIDTAIISLAKGIAERLPLHGTATTA